MFKFDDPSMCPHPGGYLVNVFAGQLELGNSVRIRRVTGVLANLIHDAGIRTRGSMHTPRHYESKSLRTLVRTRSLRSIESGTVNAAGHGGLFDVVTRLGGRVTEEKLQNVQYASDIQLQVGVGY